MEKSNEEKEYVTQTEYSTSNEVDTLVNKEIKATNYQYIKIGGFLGLIFLAFFTVIKIIDMVKKKEKVSKILIFLAVIAVISYLIDIALKTVAIYESML